MWYLECLNNSIIFLWEKDSYTVGRKNTDIIIENDDSVSRDHGLFTIKNESLYFTDHGSKYGTYVVSNKLKPKEERLLLKDEVITFGLLQNNQSKFKIKKLEFKVIFSNVKSNEKRDLYIALDFLKAQRSTVWDETCTHIVASEIILTTKILCGLTVGQHIINTKYFCDYVLAVKANSHLPKPEMYMPQFNETLLNRNIKLEFKNSRKFLFQDKIFVFLTEKSKNSLKDIINVTGGKATSWQKDEFDINILRSSPDLYLFMEENLENCNKDSKKYKKFQEAIQLIQTTGRRPIPLQEIALAIVHNSCAENCNPLFNRVGLLVPRSTQNKNSEQILAYDTEHSSSSTSRTQSQSEFIRHLPEVVEASYDTEVLTNTKTPMNTKRLLEIVDENKSNKKAKEDHASTSTEFLFRRPQNQSTPKTTESTRSKFIFTNKINTSDVNNETEINPFSRKRKASDNINIEPKKRSLENISNILSQKASDNDIFLIENNEKIQPNINVVKDASKCQPWLSKTWINSEASLNEVKINEEPEDEEICKLNEMFKDSILIKFCSIEARKYRTVPTEKTYTATTNYKNFKKVCQNIQTEIVTDLCKIVIRDHDSTFGSDEENEDDVEI